MDNEQRNQVIIDSLKLVIGIILLAIIMTMSLTSCATQKEVIDNNKVKIEYRDREVVKHDSIYIEGDTRVINDTVFKTRVEFRYKYFRDTIRVEHTDTIFSNIKEIQEVNRLTKHQQRMIAFGRQFIGLLVLVILYIAYKIYRKIKR